MKRLTNINYFIIPVMIMLIIWCSPGCAPDRPARRIPRFSHPDVCLIVNEKVPDSWKGVTYQLTDYDAETENYIAILRRELSLYPEGYLRKANVQRIVLGRDLAFNGQYRAAVPDPYTGNMYYSVNGAYGVAAEYYLVHCIHHELHHMVEFAIWHDFWYDWPEWQKLNIPGFRYGYGGEEAYTDTYRDYYSATHPEKGFLNLYSMTGDEEDRAEIMAYIMSGIERETLIRYCRVDDILRKKVKCITDLVHGFAGTRFIKTDPFLAR